MDNQTAMQLINKVAYSSSRECRKGTLRCTWGDFRNYLNERFKDSKNRVFVNSQGDEDDFPDDCDKCDICFGISDGTRTVLFWNYKNGPAYGAKVSLDDIPEFSAGGDMSLLAEIQDDFDSWRQANL